MKKYKIVTGKLENITDEIVKQLNDGWDLVGGLTTATKGSIVEYAQAFTREIIEEVKPEPKPKRRTRKKKAE